MTLKVLTLAAESAPLVKVGGLGDVVGALPRALRAVGIDARVAIPHYPAIKSQAESLGIALKRKGRVSIRWGSHAHETESAPIAETTVGGVPHYLLGGPPFRPPDKIYSTTIDDDGPKFIFYSMAAMSLCRELDWQPDIIHVHDSHAGAAIYWLAAKGKRESFWRQTASVITIHNLPFQNNHAKKYLALAGLRPSRDPRLPMWARDGLMGLAIACADRINAVSDGYAAEIMGEEYGAGLDGLLRERADRLSGILNGLDYAAWNPSTDHALAARFDAESLDHRAANKAALQKACGLKPDPHVPIIGAVSRLDYQKGFDIALPAIKEALARGEAQFILLGTGAAELEASYEPLLTEYPGAASIHLRFDSALANRIYGGCDIFLMPSRYEPCGTSQMIAMRYGAIPVARATGGLVDTVWPYRAGSGVGFLFGEYSSAALLRALRRAFRVYANGEAWRGLQRRAMAVRFSWEKSAEQYAAMYEKALREVLIRRKA
ncbi:MAG: glycogen synthase [Chloroflexi bacterium]|nr:glycogen synthase [Chloroflexota bacterium]